MNFRDITPEKWWAFEDTLIAKELNGKENIGSYEKEYRRKDGSICPVELSAFAMKDEKNNISCLWAIVRDITERKKIENILRDSETRNLKIFKESPFPIMLIDTENGCFADVNEAMSNSTGYLLTRQA
jgi:PAS domain-containing protein